MRLNLLGILPVRVEILSERLDGIVGFMDKKYSSTIHHICITVRELLVVSFNISYHRERILTFSAINFPLKDGDMAPGGRSLLLLCSHKPTRTCVGVFLPFHDR